MLAVGIDDHGGPDVLTPIQVERPRPDGDRVLVRNHWIGVDVREGSLTPRIVDQFPLSEAAAAHRRLADRSVTGKLLLTATPDT